MQFNVKDGNCLVTEEENVLVPWASISEHVSPYAAPAKRTAKHRALLWNIVSVYAAICSGIKVKYHKGVKFSPSNAAESKH